MLSRLAEHLYWHGRYLERAEGLARLVNVNAHLNLDLPGKLAPGWEPLVRITGNPELFQQLYSSDGDERQVTRFLIGDKSNPGSIHSTLSLARDNMRAARDLLPREVWEQMNKLYLEITEQVSGNLSKRRRHEALNQLILGSQQIAGTLMGTMSQDYAYDFILIGRYLERADVTTRILDVRADDLLTDEVEGLRPFESIQWMSVLKSLTGYQMYRRHVRLRVTGPDVLKFLLRDRLFPRSVVFCLKAVESVISGLPGDDDRALRSTTGLMRHLNEARMIGLKGQPLSEFIDGVQIEIAEIGAHIGQIWFQAGSDRR
ncbi:MAG: alpha-E domain-containing protein [Wenzhouxiangellaceae bacterium]|nr:alpha-E domain-containing protein [Wenzhouxiangellaceae bacterium]